jgi:hypothetical protein
MGICRFKRIIFRFHTRVFIQEMADRQPQGRYSATEYVISDPLPIDKLVHCSSNFWDGKGV